MRKVILSFLLLLFFSFFSDKVFAQKKDISDLFQNANLAYDQGEYEKATKLYQKIIQSGVKNDRVFYNLGNAYFRNKKRGLAILYYRKAWKLNPRDEDIRINLKFVKLFTIDKIEQKNTPFFLKLFFSVRNLATLDEWTLFASSLYFLGMVFLIVFVLFRKGKRLFLTLISFFLILFLLTCIFLGSKTYSEIFIKRGVVVVTQSEVRSGPGEDYTLQFNLHEGLEFLIKGEKEGWYLILLPNGGRGWLKSEAVGII